MRLVVHAVAGLTLAMLAASANAAVVTPADLAGWAGAPYGGGTTEINTVRPRNGDGSAEIVLPTGAAEVDWAYELTAPLPPLSQFTSASYEYLRDGSSTVAAHYAPSYALLIDEDCNAATAGDQSYLVYEPAYQAPGLPAATVDAWKRETVTPASVVWRSGAAVWSTQPLSDYMAGTATGSSITGASCVAAVVAFAGSGWTGAYQGAMDTVTLRMNGVEVVNANFEVAAAPVAVPTMGNWALALLVLSMAGLVYRRARG